MRPEAEAHLGRVLAEAVRLIDAKYRRGQAEHGGLLPELCEKKLLDEAISEAVDQVVYLLTLREKRELHCRIKPAHVDHDHGSDEHCRVCEPA